MKKTLLILLSVVASSAFADEVVKTTTATGTLHEYTPTKTFIVKESSGPVTYRYGKTVTYVTKKGTALSASQVRTRIKVGIPVTVHYTTEGETRVVSRVEVDDE
jgi:hypothetical protein